MKKKEEKWVEFFMKLWNFLGGKYFNSRNHKFEILSKIFLFITEIQRPIKKFKDSFADH